MPEQGLDLARVERRIGNFVLQMIGYEQRIAELEAEIARLVADDSPKGPDGGAPST